MSKHNSRAYLYANETPREDDHEPKLQKCLAYTHIGKAYTLYTVSPEVVKEAAQQKIKFEYDKKTRSFVAQANRLPRLKGVEIQEYRLQYPTPAQQDRLERAYDKVQKMRQVQEKMQHAIAKEEAKVLSLLQEVGVQLKPGAPEDVQIFLPKAKVFLHHQVNVSNDYNQKMATQLKDRCPLLKKSFKEVSFPSFDKAAFEEIKDRLPRGIFQKIHSFQVNSILKEEEGPGLGCRVCGSKFGKDRVCRHCGYEELPKK